MNGDMFLVIWVCRKFDKWDLSNGDYDVDYVI